MRITGQEESPSSAEDSEVFTGLHLVGTPGRVHVVVNERKLSIEQKTGHSTVIAHDWVMRLNHTKKPLVPNGYALLGAVLLWIGYRGMVFGTTSQLITIGIGLMCLTGRFGIKRPMLIIETQAHDCHMMTGNDATLMRLCELHSRLTDGMSLEQARLGLDQLQRDVDFPRTQAERLLPIEPVRLEAPLPLAALITNHGDEETSALVKAPLNFGGHEEPLDLDFGEPETEGWMFGEQEPLLPDLDVLNHGLIERGRANARTRRGSHSRGSEAIEPRYEHHPSHPYPVAQPADLGRSFIQIAEVNSALSHRHEVGAPSQVPSEFLPSFVGPEGAHVPQHTPPAPSELQFNPSLLTFETEPNEGLLTPIPSLVHTARIDEPLDAEIVPEHRPATHQQKSGQYIMRQRESSFSNPRWIKRANALSSSGRTRSFFDSINRNAALAGKFLTGSQSGSSTPAETETGQELRERSAQTLQEEIVNSVSNLSELNGGSLPPEEAERLQSHITRRNSIAEQILQERKEQEKVQELDELSFNELTESVENHKATAGVSGLPRLDS